MRTRPQTRTTLAAAAVTAVLAAGVGCSPRPTPTPGPGTSRYVDVPLPAGGLGFYTEGVFARRAGDDEEALRLFVQATRTDRNLILANEAAGELYRLRGEFDRSADHLARVVTLDPDNPDAHVQLGLTYEQAGRPREAADSYARGLDLDPQAVRALLGLSRIDLARGDAASALPRLERAVEHAPDDGQAWIDLGRARRDSGDLPGTQAAFETALEALPKPTTDLLEALGLLRLQLNRPQQALALLEEVARVRDTADAHKHVGDAHALLGRYDEAKRRYARALDRDPSHVPSLNAGGTVWALRYRDSALIDQSARQEAMKRWRLSLQLDADQPDVRDTLDRLEADRLFR